MKKLVDIEARGRVRKASLVPVTIAVSALTEFGRTDATSAMLKALNKLPKKWQLEIEQDANAANMEEDLAITAELEEMEEDCDEHAEISIGHELLSDFQPYASIDEDDQKVTKLQTISSTLKQELIDWKAYRTATINRFRSGSKVTEVSHEGEVATLLRFLGYVHTIKEVQHPTLKVLRNHDICQVVQDYTQWLEAKQLKWSSVTNYLAAIITAAAFANLENETPPPLDQLANMRRQTEKLAREQTLYRKKGDNWIGMHLPFCLTDTLLSPD